MVHFLQAKPSQAKPSQAKPSQVHLNIVFGFTALDDFKNAFSLKNQGKGVFLFFPFFINGMPLRHQATKKNAWSGGVLQRMFTSIEKNKINRDALILLGFSLFW